MQTLKNYINGEWVESKSGKSVQNINPANTDDVICLTPLSTKEEAQSAVKAAEDAFESWREQPPPARGNCVFRAMDLMTRRKEELAKALTREEGKILNEARGEVQKSINVLEFMAGEARRLGGETTPSELANTFCYTVRQPLGVVALITPWNFPVAIPAWKISPAIIAGNTVVFKPATFTPVTAVKLVEIFEEAGLPKGVLNLVMGSGGLVGDELVMNSTVKAVSFTGSNDVGCRLYEQGARRAIKVQCEMGGKNPIVVLEDADLPLAVESTIQGAFGSTGQRCTATSRVVIVDSVADRFVELLRERMKSIRVGDGLEEGVGMGPSVDESQMNTVLSYIEIGKGEGAKMLEGGYRLEEGNLKKGYFVVPTLFDHVKPNMRIAQEEIFGPVLSVLRVKDFDEALKVANGVKFGLSSSIYTNDASKIFKFIDRVETGITHVNSPTMGGEAQLPFGGVKGTGIGSREQGKTAFDFYTEIKTVYVDYTGKKRETSIY